IGGAGVEAVAVGAAVGEGVRHAREGVVVGGGEATEDAGDSAHGLEGGEKTRRASAAAKREGRHGLKTRDTNGGETRAGRLRYGEGRHGLKTRGTSWGRRGRDARDTRRKDTG